MNNALVIFAAAFAALPSAAVAQAPVEKPIMVIGAYSVVGENTASFQNRPVPANPQEHLGIAPTDQFRAVLNDFARCLGQYDRGAVQKVMDALPGTPELAAAARRANDNRCLAVGEFQYLPSNLYNAAYIVRYREGNRSGPPTIGQTPVDYVTLAKTLTGDPLQVYVSSRIFGDCVIRRDSKASHDVVVASPGSSSEAAAFAAIAPSLSACLTQGSEIKLTKDFVKGLLAEVMVRSAAS